MNTVFPVNAKGQEQPLKLYPWLAKTGKFGYCDSLGNLVIKPKFEEGRAFVNGYAFVKENDKYSVIDQQERVVIKPKHYSAGIYAEGFYSLYKKSDNYNAAGLYSDGLFTLFITKKEYVAWWQFWKWERGPLFFFNYSIHRTKWEILSLPDKNVIFRERLSYWDLYEPYEMGSWTLYRNDSFKFPFPIASVGKSLVIKQQLYELDSNNKIQKFDSDYDLQTTNREISAIFNDPDPAAKIAERDDLPFENAIPCQFSKHCYIGKDAVTKKFGIYDSQKESWILQPEYNKLKEEIAEHIVVYSEISHPNGWPEDFLGLLDTKNNKVLTPAKYHQIDVDGRVSVTENGKRIYYYINISTGKEYRE
ncbi:WG repeat-containing protein [Pedobacter sp. PAMC26386]|nr:WG repeat-containing protein [Pedobacter sp. PAMC26386]